METPPKVKPAKSLRTAGLLNLLLPGDVVLTMGAGDVTQVGPQLLRALRGEPR